MSRAGRCAGLLSLPYALFSTTRPLRSRHGLHRRDLARERVGEPPRLGSVGRRQRAPRGPSRHNDLARESLH
eukprot:scaffold85740_cov66-Phaeocystis_antarctica.AAC.17